MGIGLRHEGSFHTRGFTLVELLITLTVLGVLASVAMPLVEVTVKRTREIELRRGLREIREGIDRFKVDYDRARQNARDAREIFKARVSSDRSGYPLTLEELVETKTLRRIPKDPMSTEGRWVIRSYPDSLDTTLTDRRGIFVVPAAVPPTALGGGPGGA